MYCVVQCHLQPFSLRRQGCQRIELLRVTTMFCVCELVSTRFNFRENISMGHLITANIHPKCKYLKPTNTFNGQLYHPNISCYIKKMEMSSTQNHVEDIVNHEVLGILFPIFQNFILGITYKQGSAPVWDD